jgi:hypothetical protein
MEYVNLGNCQILISDHFGFWVISGRVGSGIGLYQVVSGYFGFRVLSDRVGYRVI